ncbi:MAG TPA: amidohydrolase family protein [Chryseosolibacter sp.]|nr:amidohydrolase family protein [Chryseosolibacter sp.]
MIDSHQHFWKYDPSRHSWITDDMKAIRRDFQPGDLRPLLKKNHIESCVSVQVDQTEDETLSLLALANQHDFIKGVVGWIDLRNANLESRLEYFSALKKLKGFRHIVQGEKSGFLSQPAFIEGVRKLSKYHFTYDLLVYHHQLGEALSFLKQVPETKIVIDHLAKPAIASMELEQWRRDMRAMAAFPNVYCKVSGMVTEAKWPGWKYDHFVPYLDLVTEAFGASRLMYGSDWPVCLVAASYDEQFSIVRKYFTDFPAQEKKQILGENAKRFYNL